LDRETYAIHVLQMQEVLRYSDVIPVPGAPDNVLGILNLRGNIVTVMDIRRCLGLPSTGHHHSAVLDPRARILIVETNAEKNQQKSIALVVDSVSEMIHLHASDIDVLSMSKEHSHLVQGVLKRNGKVIILINMDHLVVRIAPVI